MLVALGNITIMWAGISLVLNRFIEIHMQQAGHVIRKDIPRSFTGKLDYMDKFERTNEWAPERLAEFRDIRLTLAQLNQERINIVHGLLMRRGYGPHWNIHIAKEIEDRLHRDKLPHTSQDIHELTRRLSDMVRRVTTFFSPLIAE